MKNSNLESEEAASDVPMRLHAPPRLVPRLLPLYLMLLSTQLGWLSFGVGLLSFWIWCGFGADVKAILFLAPKQKVQGTVTRIEATPFREGSGSSPGPGKYSSLSTRPIYAVHYAFVLPSGQRLSGISYGPGDAETGPSLWVHDPHSHSLRFGDMADVPLTAGMAVPVETVRGSPSVSRLDQMGSNVFPPYRLIILAFTALGVVWMLPGLRNYRRVRTLLELGVEDKKGENLCDPAGLLANLPISPPADKWLGIRDDELHNPSLVRLALVLLVPVLGLTCTGVYVHNHLAEIVYTWHTLLGGG